MKKVVLFLLVFVFALNKSDAQTCLPEGINFSTQSQIDSFMINYPGCTGIEGFVIVGAENGWDDIDIANFDSLINVTSIGEYLKLWNNDPLSDLTGLNNLTSIGGDLLIESNSSLESLNGLDNLTSIGGEMKIYANNYMTSTEGVNSLSSIGGDLKVQNNNALPSVSGLSSIETINGDLIIMSNYSLLSLEGLNSIAASSITSLNITSNSSLTDCAVQSVCDYLDLAENVVSISNNAGGCNNVSEVEQACVSLSVEELNAESQWSIYPNPATSMVYISSNQTIDKVYTYNHIGQLAIQELSIVNSIDVSSLSPGVYIIEVEAGDTKQRKKLIIE